MTKIFHTLFNRLTLIGLIFILQIAFLFVEFVKFTKYYVAIGVVCELLSVAVAFVILYKESSPSIKIAWIIPILLFPLFGGIMFLFFGHVIIPRKMNQNMKKTEEAVMEALPKREEVLQQVSEENPSVGRQMTYISRYGYGQPWKNVSTQYFPIGEEFWSGLLQDLEKAEKYIFMEYFIVCNGIMWDSILEILQRKVKEGVEVRLMYDDVGSIMYLPTHYDQTLEKMGIKCVSFNKLTPVIALILNNRDHRKITVIDGKVAYNGGINLADEYINQKQTHGHWKDIGIRLEGPAAWNFTVMFLQLWNSVRFTENSYLQYMADGSTVKQQPDNGYVMPFGDTPLDCENVGENVYLNMITSATEYVYIYTPYLIVDYEMMNALCLAAKNGVDVRIVTPGIPDKKAVYYLTQSSYHMLYEAGVKIYQYTPGFLHGKCVLCDDEYAVVGTINFDYRSLYHHFECGTYLYRTSCLRQIREDMEQVFEISEEVDDMFFKKHRFSGHILGPVLRLFAPLM